MSMLQTPSRPSLRHSVPLPGTSRIKPNLLGKKTRSSPGASGWAIVLESEHWGGCGARAVYIVLIGTPTRPAKESTVIRSNAVLNDASHGHAGSTLTRWLILMRCSSRTASNG